LKQNDINKESESSNISNRHIDRPLSTGSAQSPIAQSCTDENLNSVFVKNVHFKATVESIKEHFKDCCTLKGAEGIKRVTILKDKRTGNPKGFAYIEFETLEAA